MSVLPNVILIEMKLVKVRFFPNVKLWFVNLTLFEFSCHKQDSKLLETAHFKVSQVQIDGFSTILDEQNFTFKQIRQAETPILVKLSRNFCGKIQIYLKSVTYKN